MKTTVCFELTPKEYEIVQKALYNYRGRLIHLKQNGRDYEEVIEGTNEMKFLENMIRELTGENQTTQRR